MARETLIDKEYNKFDSNGNIRTLTPETLHQELRVGTTVQQNSITPTAGKKIRISGFQCSMLVTAALTSTLRGTLAYGTAHTGDASKILASYRITAGDDAYSNNMTGINVIGETNENVTLTNTTFSNGNVITRAVVYYTEE